MTGVQTCALPILMPTTGPYNFHHKKKNRNRETGGVFERPPNNACRAELGVYPLLIKIQKRATKFYLHLSQSDENTFHHKALLCQKMKPDKSPLIQLVQRLCSPNPTEPQDSSHLINPKQIAKQQKEKYIMLPLQNTSSPPLPQHIKLYMCGGVFIYIYIFLPSP